MLLPLESFFWRICFGWMTDENLDWIITVVLLPGIFLWYIMYLYLFDAHCEFEWCYVLYIPLELKWKETYWNWSGPPLCLFHWHVIFLMPAMSLRPDNQGCLRLAWCLDCSDFQMLDGCATVIMLQKWYENSQCPKCPMMKFDLNKFFSWIFTFGFTGKTPWTTTN